MRLPMLTLAGGCLAIGLVGPFFVPAAMGHLLAELGSIPPQNVQPLMEAAMNPLFGIAAVAGAFVIMTAVIAGLRKGLLFGKPVEQAETWGCGYAAPTSRMQYTASSFAQPLVSLFHAILRTRPKASRPVGLFPGESTFATETGDLFRTKLYGTLFAGIETTLARLRWLQQGRVQLYVLYIMITLLFLLAWRLG